MEKTRILIVDDAAQVRDGLRNALELGDGLEVVAEACDGREALRMVEEYRPNLVLMDARMPVMDGLEAPQLIKSRWPEVKVVVLTMHPSYKADALAAGADAFIAKGCSVEKLLEVVSGREQPNQSGRG